MVATSKLIHFWRSIDGWDLSHPSGSSTICTATCCTLASSILLPVLLPISSAVSLTSGNVNVSSFDTSETCISFSSFCVVIHTYSLFQVARPTNCNVFINKRTAPDTHAYRFSSIDHVFLKPSQSEIYQHDERANCYGYYQPKIPFIRERTIVKRPESQIVLDVIYYIILGIDVYDWFHDWRRVLSQTARTTQDVRVENTQEYMCYCRDRNACQTKPGTIITICVNHKNNYNNDAHLGWSINWMPTKSVRSSTKTPGCCPVFRPAPCIGPPLKAILFSSIDWFYSTAAIRFLRSALSLRYQYTGNTRRKSEITETTVVSDDRRLCDS